MANNLTLDQNAVALARQNVCEGKIVEPRVYYDSLTMNATAGIITEGSPDVFRNGEQFPVRITHILAAYRPNNATSTTPPERQVQRANLRIMQHDQYYMNRDFVPLPLWSNIIVAGPQVVSQGTSTWVFDQPFVLSTRDTMQVKVALEFVTGTDSARTCSVSFSGYGMISKRPFFVSASADLIAAPTTLPTDKFRNDGAEPWVVVAMTVTCGAQADSASPQGDIRQLRVQVRQVGNGTNADWGSGPLSPPLAECPATLFGMTSGRAVVHRIPSGGWIWEPGEGVSIEATESVASGNSSRLAIGMIGHIELV